MDYLMLKSFDHAGYDEKRLILMIVGISLSFRFATRRRDYRYLVMFASGAVFMSRCDALKQ